MKRSLISLADNLSDQKIKKIKPDGEFESPSLSMKRSLVSLDDNLAENLVDQKMKKMKPYAESDSLLMKRSLVSLDDNLVDQKMKKIKLETEFAESKMDSVLLDEDLLSEVLKHADARTLGATACVNKQWHKAATDERLWELICTKQWANIGCGKQQLRSVVLALGGFRRLHALYLWPLAKPAAVAPASHATTSSAWPCVPVPKAGPAKTRWGKDEVHLSLSLLSIRYYEKMNFSSKRKIKVNKIGLIRDS